MNDIKTIGLLQHYQYFIITELVFPILDCTVLYKKPSMTMINDNVVPYLIQSITLADDDRNDHGHFRDALRDIHSDIWLNVVDNGAELLQMLSHYKPDILFLELDMPIKNGLECLQSIRNNPNTLHLPVVVFSSTTRSVNIDTAYDIGADLFYTKHSSFEELKSAIKVLLSLEWQWPGKVKEQYCVNGRYTAFM